MDYLEKKIFQGFLLLEVIIAMALLSIVGVLFSQVFFSSIVLKEEIELSSNRYHIACQAIARMAKEISMAYLSKQRNHSNLIVDTQFYGVSDRIKFIAFGNVVREKNAKLSDQREISYYLKEDKRTGKKLLLRRIKINPWLYSKKNGLKQILCKDISELKFSYWNAKNREWKFQYIIQGFKKNATLPERIKIELTVIIEGEKVQKFLTQSEIRILKPISFK